MKTTIEIDVETNEDYCRDYCIDSYGLLYITTVEMNVDYCRN